MLAVFATVTLSTALAISLSARAAFDALRREIFRK